LYVLSVSLRSRTALLTAPVLDSVGPFGITASAAPVAYADTANCSTAYLPLPDPSCTPSVLNPVVKRAPTWCWQHLRSRRPWGGRAILAAGWSETGVADPSRPANANPQALTSLNIDHARRIW
jgi:hypothetical protein